MTTFEWTTLGLILFGMVIPFWLMTALAGINYEQNRRRAAKQDKRQSFVHEYVELSTKMNEMLTSGKENLPGPALAAYLRELKKYPEYKDMSILYLETVTVTGDGRFDEIARNELKATEEYLLGLDND
ncbi:hypothetical protein J3454_13855 [Erythrobacter sp. NFXS35]|uniref:hypothetical protein n=1 Tax=Erythrobacter sp. NFXS35 TaxID=2818436 RepID=UPI0032DE574F